MEAIRAKIQGTGNSSKYFYNYFTTLLGENATIIDISFISHALVSYQDIVFAFCKSFILSWKLTIKSSRHSK